jgi:hypothetical protein
LKKWPIGGNRHDAVWLPGGRVGGVDLVSRNTAAAAQRGNPEIKRQTLMAGLPPKGLPRKTRPLLTFCSQNIRLSMFFIAFGGRSGHANRHQFPAFGNWLSVPAFCRLN